MVLRTLGDCWSFWPFFFVPFGDDLAYFSRPPQGKSQPTKRQVSQGQKQASKQKHKLVVL